ncbi:MAG: hypothetical protein HY540_08335 [Deltaproteobacteria bacterium]|nr:hypothetical protein [Deltaproteobacteria bacterium]
MNSIGPNIVPSFVGSIIGYAAPSSAFPVIPALLSAGYGMGYSPKVIARPSLHVGSLRRFARTSYHPQLGNVGDKPDLDLWARLLGQSVASVEKRSGNLTITASDGGRFILMRLPPVEAVKFSPLLDIQLEKRGGTPVMVIQRMPTAEKDRLDNICGHYDGMPYAQLFRRMLAREILDMECVGWNPKIRPLDELRTMLIRKKPYVTKSLGVRISEDEKTRLTALCEHYIVAEAVLIRLLIARAAQEVGVQ